MNLAPPLDVLHEEEKLMWGISDKTEVVDEEEDGDADMEVVGGNDDLWEAWRDRTSAAM